MVETSCHGSGRRRENFLSTTLASSQFNLNGTMDVVVVDSAYIEDNNIPAGVRVGLELKKGRWCKRLHASHR